jgi:hypothetical protein
MPYARRNALGEIESLHAQPVAGASQPVDVHSPEVRRFLGLEGAAGDGSYAALDGDFVRVLEDLVDVLAAKGVLAVGELPVAAQVKYLMRKEHRENRQRRPSGPGYLDSGVVTVIDDSAFGQLADLDPPPPGENGRRA